jgi:hypothetical protein
MKRLLILISFLIFAFQAGGQDPVIRATAPYRATVVSNYPACLNTNTWGWYISTAGVTKDGSNHVTRWNSYLGANHLSTYGGTPHWSTDGILFDGVGDYLKTAAATLNQGFEVYMVVKHVTHISNAAFFDGNTWLSTICYDKTPSPDIGLYAGSVACTNNDLATNTWGILRVVFNGASSKLQINGNAAETGNPGAGNAGGFTLAAGGDGSGRFSNTQYKEIIVRAIVDSGGDETSILDYLNTKYTIYSMWLIILLLPITLPKYRRKFDESLKMVA